ncbi:hypothetical protein L596_008291 [Steinernema carpocapsae]|uniref:Peptidase S1 domain-containing protein n=1 Tax=Steinernema carpocapsae TaxID=34508 RepID=A0A4U5PC14_STECR|nr:hypothetical protein L596_008291 [Steinernema carpocapsae]
MSPKSASSSWRFLFSAVSIGSSVRSSARRRNLAPENKNMKRNASSDVALLLLSNPIEVCNAAKRSPQSHFEILRLPMSTGVWNRVEDAHCTLFGYGRSEERQRKLDLNLRRMKVRLHKVKKPYLKMKLGRRQKICEGDSGSPVVCVHQGIRYLIGISTSVQSTESSDKPQLCGMRTKRDDSQYAIITSAKFYDVREGISEIFKFLKAHNQIDSFVADYNKCFYGNDLANI